MGRLSRRLRRRHPARALGIACDAELQEARASPVLPSEATGRKQPDQTDTELRARVRLQRPVDPSSGSETA
jgi:hypothetical protein